MSAPRPRLAVLCFAALVALPPSAPAKAPLPAAEDEGKHSPEQLRRIEGHDDVVWGVVSQVGEQGLNVGRNAVLGAGWPESIPGTTVDRQCGSSQQAVHFAAAAVISGQVDVASIHEPA